MISIKTEKSIRKLLKVNLPDREIARRAKVCHETVAGIRKMLNAVKQVPKATRENIKHFLEAGRSAGSIEMRFRIPRATVIAIRRYYYLRKCEIKIPKVHIGPEIPALKIPPLAYDIPSVICLTPVAQQMYKVIHDIVDLDELAVITNPLFHHIALYAKTILDEVKEGKNE